MKILLVLGTRPQIIKSAPIIEEVLRYEDIELQVVHTGQHYDYEMSKVFFKELNVADLFRNLNVGSGTHGWQTGNMLIRLEEVMNHEKPDWVLVPGDTNSTLAGALAAAKLNMRLAHIESGARSYDMNMPEEINRRLTDHCSDVLFTVTKNCRNNLLKEGIPEESIFLVGDTMYDVLLSQLPKIEVSQIIEKLNLVDNEYAVITTHRQENVDDEKNLSEIVEALITLDGIEIVFPIHPRTRKQLKRTNRLSTLEKADHIKLLSPLGYHDMLKLVRNARMLLTDSGGMQKEALWLETRCITLRDTTEWIETIEIGVNVLVGSDKTSIIKEVKNILTSDPPKNIFDSNPYGDGKAAKKIVNILKQAD